MHKTNTWIGRWKTYEVHTLPCSFNLVKVSESPAVGAVGAVVRAAIGENLLTEEVWSWEGVRWRKTRFRGLFKWRKPLDFRATAIFNSCVFASLQRSQTRRAFRSEGRERFCSNTVIWAVVSNDSFCNFIFRCLKGQS